MRREKIKAAVVRDVSGVRSDRVENQEGELVLIIPKKTYFQHGVPYLGTLPIKSEDQGLKEK